jgi:hypothetical protein
MVPFLQAGPNFNWAHDMSDFNGDNYEKGSPTTFDVGFCFGAGLQFKTVQLSYDFGFRNVTLPNYKDIKGNYISNSFSFIAFFDFRGKRPSSHRKYYISEDYKHLSAPYMETVKVPNTSSKDIERLIRLYDILFTYNNKYVRMAGTNNVHVSFSAINPDGNIIASKRNNAYKVLDAENQKYDNNVKALQRYVSGMQAMFNYTQMTDREFQTLMEKVKNAVVNGHYVSGEQLSQQAVFARPYDEEAMLCYGICLYENDNLNKSLSVLSTFMPNDPRAMELIKYIREDIAENKRKENQRQLEQQRLEYQREIDRKLEQMMWWPIIFGR